MDQNLVTVVSAYAIGKPPNYSFCGQNSSLLMYTGVLNFFVNATGEFIKCHFYRGKRVHIHCVGVQCYSLKTDGPNYIR